MKKILIVITILFSLKSTAQNIDTVFVRNLTLQAGDWAYLVGSYNLTLDSVSMSGYRKIRAKIQEAIPPSWTTNVTIDSIPGRTVVEFYQIIKSSPAGEIATRYTAITNAIAAKTNITYWVGYFDAANTSEFVRKRDKGKNLLID